MSTPVAEAKQGLPVKLPLPLYGKLRQRAYDQQESMNSIVVRALEKELSDENR